MKGKIAKGLFVVTVTLIGVLFSACDKALGALDNLTGGVFGGEVPVYRGMSISSSKNGIHGNGNELFKWCYVAWRRKRQ